MWKKLKDRHKFYGRSTRGSDSYNFNLYDWRKSAKIMSVIDGGSRGQLFCHPVGEGCPLNFRLPPAMEHCSSTTLQIQASLFRRKKNQNDPVPANPSFLFRKKEETNHWVLLRWDMHVFFSPVDFPVYSAHPDLYVDTIVLSLTPIQTSRRFNLLPRKTINKLSYSDQGFKEAFLRPW